MDTKKFNYQENSININSHVNLFSYTGSLLSNIQPFLLCLTFQDKIQLLDQFNNIYTEFSNPEEAKTIAFSDNCNLLAVGSSGHVFVYDYCNKTKIFTQNVERVTIIKFSPDTNYLLYAYDWFIAVYRIQKENFTFIKLLSIDDKKGSITTCSFNFNKFKHLSFVVGTDKGAVVCFTNNNSETIYFNDKEIIRDIHFFTCEELFFIANDFLYIYILSDIGIFEKKSKLNLFRVQPQNINFPFTSLFIHNTFFAFITDDHLIRIFYPAYNFYYTLTLAIMIQLKDVFTSISFNTFQSILVAGTNKGYIYIWKYLGHLFTEEINQFSKDTDFIFLQSIYIGKNILSLKCGAYNSILINTSERSFILSEKQIQEGKMYNNTTALQTTDQQIVFNINVNQVKTLNSNSFIFGFDINDRYLALWNGKQVEVYDYLFVSNSDHVTRISSFNSNARIVKLYNEQLFLLEYWKVFICNLEGRVVCEFPFNLHADYPISFDISSQKIFFLTNSQKIYLGTIDQNDFVLDSSPIDYFNQLSSHFTSLKSNSNGSILALLNYLDNDLGYFLPDTKIFFSFSNSKKILSYDFGPYFYPCSYFWDKTHPQVLTVQLLSIQTSFSRDKFKEISAKSINASTTEFLLRNKGVFTNAFSSYEISSLISPNKKTPLEGKIVVLFINYESNQKVLLHDSFSIDINQKLLGLDIPHIYSFENIIKPINNNEDNNAFPAKKIHKMHLFTEIQDLSSLNFLTIVDFAFAMTFSKNIDFSFQNLSSEFPSLHSQICQNLLYTSIRTRNLQLALDYFKITQKSSDILVNNKADLNSLADISLQLGFFNDAIEIFYEAKNYKRLSELYLSLGRWEEAIAVASLHGSKMYLRNIFYRYAQHLESISDITTSIKFYELSESSEKEVPRMLLENQRLIDLENYINSKQSKKLFQWWARFNESLGNIKIANCYYEKAGDYLSLVRICILSSSLSQAADIAFKSNNKQALFYVAKQYEMKGDFHDALKYFSLSKKFDHAVRIALNQEFIDDLMPIAIEASIPLMQDVAKYFESKHFYLNAFQLYQKSENYKEAFLLAVEQKMTDVLIDLSHQLPESFISEKIDPSLLLTAAQIMLETSHFDAAIHFFVFAQNYEEALKILIENRVIMTEDLLNKTTPPKLPNATEDQKEKRINLIMKLAEHAQGQGLYLLAAKKYTQAGDKMKALNNLLLANEYEKIFLYVTTAKKAELYQIAIDYFQTIPQWFYNPQILFATFSCYLLTDNIQDINNCISKILSTKNYDYSILLSVLTNVSQYMQKEFKTLSNLENKCSLIQSHISAVEKLLTNLKI